MNTAPSSVDFDRIAESVSPGQLADSIGAKKSKRGGNYHCPNGAGHSNGDRTPSLSIDRKDGRTVVHCFGCGLSGSPVQVAAELWKVDRHDAAKKLAGSIGIQPATNGRRRSEIVAEYVYTDADDNPVGRVLRKPNKDFPQQHWCTEVPDGWNWGLGGNSERCGCARVSLPLFRLSDVLEAVALNKLIHVVEGEKDVLAVEKAGGVATCNPGGTGGWRDEYAEILRDARVRVWADGDEAGRKHARTVAESLEGVAASVEIVEAREGKDAHDHLRAGHGLEDFEPVEGEEDPDRKLPAPISVAELMEVEEPDEDHMVEGLLPAGGNILFAGYPKTYKTMFLLLLAVCLAAGLPFLGFPVPKSRRVGIVLMEDQAHRILWRLRRLCIGLGIRLEDLEGWLHFWFRPPLRLSDETAVELAAYARELDLDYLHIDSWAYVATGDSNSADDVTPQLQTLSGCRVERPGLGVGLTHHARKDWGKDAGGTRLTDEIRNSSAFGAWFDAGLLLTRKDEDSPVKVRAELRDLPAPDSFAFTVEDEDPAGPHNGYRSSGWLRLVKSDHRPELLDRMAAAENLVPAVREFIALNPECSKRALRGGVQGKARDVDGALEVLETNGEVVVKPPEGPGKASKIMLVEGSES